MSNIKSYDIDSLSELLQVVEEIGKDFKCNIDEIWYRGVSQEKYKLVPGYYRDIVDKNHEESIIQDFLSNYRMYTNDICDNHLEIYSLMQHYGLPTRLLDWSKSALVACYFALSKIKRDDIEDHRIIWAMNPAELNKLSFGEFGTLDLEIDLHKISKLKRNIAGVIAINPSFTNRRIITQKGHFTIHFSEKPIEEYFIGNSNDIVKIKINNDEMTAFKMRRQLYALGLKEDDIYQDLDSLSKRIIRERQSPLKVVLNQLPKEYFEKK